MTATSFTDQMIYFRITKGLSQSELARRIDMDKSSISRIEAGERPATRDQAILIARAMELDDHDTDTLLMSANYLPLNGSSLLSDPRLQVLNDVLPLMDGQHREQLIARLDELCTAAKAGASYALTHG
jgi:transcriptional regulator with XRE-family HTH domain